MVVVKVNGYGYGFVEVVCYVLEYGVSEFVVVSVEEGIVLWKVGIIVFIFVFGFIFFSCVKKLVVWNIILLVF